MRSQLGPVVARRMLQAVPIVAGVVVLTFVFLRVVPGDPAVLIAGQAATPEQIAQVSQQLGTDQPLLVQFGRYLGDLARLDLGTSIFTGNPVVSDLAIRLPATLELVTLSLLVAVLVGVPAGAAAARRRNTAADTGTRTASFVLLATPDFWLGLLLSYVFFFQLGWAPQPIGQLSQDLTPPQTITGAALLDSLLTGNGTALRDAAAHAVLPVLTMGLIYAAPLARLARSATLEALEADYVRFARACGLTPSLVRRYAWRGALPPVVTFVGILVTGLLGGAVLVESVYAWGGAAQYAVDAVSRTDYPAVQAFVLVAALVSVAVFLCVDLLYMVIDPRVRL